MMQAHRKPSVDNSVYYEWDRQWYEGQDHPVALLRAESRLKNAWVESILRRERMRTVLDIGCGGGLLSNHLATAGYAVTGIDVAPKALEVARRFDPTQTVRYINADAAALPFPNSSFDAVCMMDFLEHVENPGSLVAEAARTLRPGGLLVFHTFNRNPLSWLVIIQGMKWFVPNTPPRLHVLRLFLKPSEVRAACARNGLRIESLLGCRPKLSRAFFRLLLSHRVPEDFEFTLTRSILLGYVGTARKAPYPVTS